ncbi:hypothetical protein [Vibrio sp. 1CM23M]|uniref:hypothetical protein n=1 Tax=Vibrio sp. 1CM23M TaxID=2929164 RepID=UPI0020C00AB9|nr:hypothetical protein [Vibrio sp. 1CM23M]MCK8071280.1 hypothetical protein [Vibrio sp. 1CM23M]
MWFEIPDSSFLGSGMTVVFKFLYQLSSFPAVRDERDRESRLWFEIPDTSFLGSGMTVILKFIY